MTKQVRFVRLFECANDLMAWLNTLELKTVEKKEVYKWAMEWRPREYKNNDE